MRSYKGRKGFEPMSTATVANYKTLIYEVEGKLYTYECAPNTIQFNMSYQQVEKFFLNEFGNSNFAICGWL